MTPTARDAILAHCRRHGIWVIADDAYERLFYGAQGTASAVAPSFLSVADPDERVISANTFSKAWLMTGWRLGWIVAPPTLMPGLSTLIEYSTSCAPGFVQRGGIVALRQGEPVIERTVRRFQAARDYLLRQLSAIPGVRTTVPAGAMYVFFSIDGVEDSVAFCRRLILEHGLGLAPGLAFGPEGEGYIRWCFAATEARLADGIERLRRSLQP
jgi:aspartate/methionine/tyrosine aminotransferase